MCTQAWIIVMPKKVVLSTCAFTQQSNEEAVNTDWFSHQSCVFLAYYFTFWNPGRLFASNAKATVGYYWSLVHLFFSGGKKCSFFTFFFLSVGILWNTLGQGSEQAICCPLLIVSETLTTFGSGLSVLFTDLQSSASSCAWPGCDLSPASALRWCSGCGRQR